MSNEPEEVPAEPGEEEITEEEFGDGGEDVEDE